MRVVGGSARGRKLHAVPGRTTRPILDRVKTSLGDILRPRISGLHVLDVFAGTGSVGIELLSQGAAHCTFLDLEPKAIATIKKNLALTDLSDRADVRQTDALAYLKHTEKTFDVIYVAPPQFKKLWVQAMHLLAGRPQLLTGGSGELPEGHEPGLAVVQIDPREYESLDLGVLRETRQKRYGNTLLAFFEPVQTSRGEGNDAADCDTNSTTS
jgi:16S rRNA (guanine(966)-N(2))-methyltransferase RsmD